MYVILQLTCLVICLPNSWMKSPSITDNRASERLLREINNKGNYSPAFTLNHIILSIFNEISIRISPFVNSNRFFVLISELLIKTHACLSRVSCRLIDWCCPASALFRLLSCRPAATRKRGNRESIGRGLSSPQCQESISSYSCSNTDLQAIVTGVLRLDEHQMHSDLMYNLVDGCQSLKHLNPAFLSGLKPFQCQAVSF